MEQEYTNFTKLLTKKELSEALNVSISLIDKLLKNEDFPRVKIGKAIRFDLSQVMKWVQNKNN